MPSIRKTSLLNVSSTVFDRAHGYVKEKVQNKLIEKRPYEHFSEISKIIENDIYRFDMGMIEAVHDFTATEFEYGSRHWDISPRHGW